MAAPSGERCIVRVWEPLKEKEGRKTLALTKTTTTKQLSEQVSRKLGVQATSLKLIASTFGNQRTLAPLDCPWDAFESGGNFFFFFLFFSFLLLLFSYLFSFFLFSFSFSFLWSISFF